MAIIPGPRPGPRPGPVPGSPAGSPVHGELPELPVLPDAQELAAMTIREHVALFEDVQRALADRLDDSSS